MVILLGGTGCTGKTYLSQQLLERHKISYFSLDYLMMALHKGMNDCGFTPLDDQYVLGEKMWPIVKSLIITYIENDHNMIIEDFQLLPHLVADLIIDYPHQIIPLFMCLSKNYIENNFTSGILEYRNIAENRSDIDDLTPDVLVKENLRLIEMCKKYRLRYFVIDENYDSAIEKIHEYINNQFLIMNP